MTAETPFFAVSAELRGDTAIVSVAGEVDMSTSEELRATIDTAAARVSCVVLDVSDLSFIDSTGLRVLVSTHETLAAGKTDFVVRNPSARVQRLFEISGIERLLVIEHRAAD